MKTYLNNLFQILKSFVEIICLKIKKKKQLNITQDISSEIKIKITLILMQEYFKTADTVLNHILSLKKWNIGT